MSPATEAVYTVEAINNTNNCKAVDTYHLPLEIAPVVIDASSSPLTNCTPLNGIVFAFIANTDPNSSGNFSNNYSFTWYTGNIVGGTPTYNGRLVNGLDKGPYTVVAIDNADNFCQATETVVIQDGRIFTAPIAVQISPVTNCDSARPNGVASASVDNAGVKDSISYKFNWYLGTDTTVAPIYTGSEIIALTDTLYTVVATNIITSCPSVSSIEITNDFTAVPAPTVTVISDVTSCRTKNGAISASINGDTKDYIFYWSRGSTVKSSPDFTGDTWAPTNPGLDIGLYTVEAQSRITGCISPSATGEIKTKLVYPIIDVKTVGSGCDLKDEAGHSYGNGRAEVILGNNVSIESIVWSIGDPPLTGPVIDTLSAGIYSVKVTTTEGCSDSVQFQIKNDVRPYNGISRNGDALNEMFRIGCIEMFPNNNVRIFNRAGTLVYEEHGYDNATVFFDGHSNRGVSPMGTWLPDGTYFYLIDRGDGAKPLAGYLEIVK
ncbi:MAG: gliding motility-associated C-terminal domain-containing protein [Cyclobacteriaceae bacterium]